MRSDSDPNGKNQLGAALNPLWDLHLLKYDTTKSNVCKALAYMKKPLTTAGLIFDITMNPIANPNIITLDIKDETLTAFCLINVYHEVPLKGHRL
jgi:hypothetical protein